MDIIRATKEGIIELTLHTQQPALFSALVDNPERQAHVRRVMGECLDRLLTETDIALPKIYDRAEASK